MDLDDGTLLLILLVGPVSILSLPDDVHVAIDDDLVAVAVDNNEDGPKLTPPGVKLRYAGIGYDGMVSKTGRWWCPPPPPPDEGGEVIIPPGPRTVVA